MRFLCFDSPAASLRLIERKIHKQYLRILKTCLPSKMSKSKARWRILRNAIVEKKLTAEGDGAFNDSVRRFQSFDLFLRKQCNCVSTCDKPTTRKTKQQCQWFSYTCQEVTESADVWIKHPDPSVNVKVWFFTFANQTELLDNFVLYIFCFKGCVLF